MSPLFLFGLLAVGIYEFGKKPSKSLNLFTFKPFFKLDPNCSKVVGLSDWVTNSQLLKADNDQLNKFILNNKNKDIWQITEDVLIKRYGEKCYKTSPQLQNFLLVSQFSDIARVMFLYDQITNYKYDDLIFKKLYKWLQDKKLISPYVEGTQFLQDHISDQELINQLIPVFIMYPSTLEKDSFALAIPILFGTYIKNDPNVFIYDYNVNTSPETMNRWNRYANIVNKAKEQFKGLK